MFKQIIKQLTEGITLPLARDADRNKPSATLWFAYISFFMALGSVIHLTIKGDPFLSAMTSISFWAIATIFYRMRTLNKFKVDLDDKEIEIDGGDDEPSTK
jgi:hypothetical protein